MNHRVQLLLQFFFIFTVKEIIHAIYYGRNEVKLYRDFSFLKWQQKTL